MLIRNRGLAMAFSEDRTARSPGPRILEIQILRGIAVLAVIINHFSDFLPGGFLGVDMFFVISGYVIARSFVELVGRGAGMRKTLQEFWYRRFWRLFPAVSVVAATTIVAAFLLLPPSDFIEQVEMSIWVAAFAGNIGVEVVTRETYFEPGARENWFLHTWSLGVEEQFYLLFPLLMIFFLTAGVSLATRRRAIGAVAAVGGFSLLAAFANDIESWVWGTEIINTTTGVAAFLGYYSPLSRAWQFCLGVLIFLVTMNRSWHPRRGIALISLLVLTGSFVLGFESELLPGPLTIIPTLATGVLLLYRFNSQRFQPSRKFLAWVGNLSYSLYLWHWPVWSVVTRFVNGEFVAPLLSLLVTFVFASLTYKLIEKRFQTRGLRNKHAGESQKTLDRGRGLKRVLILLSLFTLGPLSWAVYSALEQSGDVRPRQSTLRVDENISCSSVSCLDGPVDVILLGDSHAGALANSLGDRLDPEGLSMIAAIFPGCPYFLSETIRTTEATCGIDLSDFEAFLVQSRAQVVVIYGYAAGRFTTTNSGGSQEIRLFNEATGELVTDDSGQEAYRTALSETLELLTQYNKQVVIVSEAPDFDFRPEEVNVRGEEASVLELLVAGRSHGQGQTVSRLKFEERHGGFAQTNLELAREFPKTAVISAWNLLCERNECSQITDDGDFIFSDQDHLGNWGADALAQGIVASLVFDEIKASK